MARVLLRRGASEGLAVEGIRIHERTIQKSLEVVLAVSEHGHGRIAGPIFICHQLDEVFDRERSAICERTPSIHRRPSSPLSVPSQSPLRPHAP